MTENANTITIILIVASVILLVCWIVWAVRLFIANHRLKSRNKLLLKRFQDLLLERRKTSTYEDLLDTKAAAAEEREAYTEYRAKFRLLENRVRQTRIYRNSKVTKAELSDMIALDPKEFDALFRDCSQVESFVDWIDGFRIADAIPMLRQMKEERKHSPSKNEVHEDATMTQEDTETKVNKIAQELGFSGRRALNGACKRVLGMGVHELIMIL